MFAFHAALEDVSPSYRDGLAKMAEFLASITNDRGELSFLGDDDGGRFFSPYGQRGRFGRATLATVSLLLGKCFFPFSQQDIGEIALWWLGSEYSKHPVDDAPHHSSRAFVDSGIVVIRRADVHALFDAGPFGPGSGGHSHSDTLSLVVSTGGDEVLIDSGTYSYMDPEWRNTFRGSAAHNTIRIDGYDQATTNGPFRWAQKPEVELREFASQPDRDRVVAVCRYRGFSHTRTIEFDGTEFTIVDQVDGPEGEHHVEQFWHFAVRPIEQAPGRWSIGDFAEFAANGGQLEEGWRSRCFGLKEAASVIVVRRRCTLPVTLRAQLRLNRD
jgi:hypothetical protein